MLFSNHPVAGIAELKEFLPFSSNYDYERVYSLLSDAERTYIIPLLGDPLYKKIIGSVSGFVDEIHLCRKALANITVYENFTLLNTQILRGGFARLTGDKTDSLYKYQEDDLKDIFRRNGFDQLDMIIDHFNKNIVTFPEFKESEYYTSTRGGLVPDRFVFSRYYKPVGYVVFKYLQSFLRLAEDLDLSQIIDPKELREAILSDTLTADQCRTLELVQPILVNLAVAYAIEDRGVNISDAGVWLENRVSGGGTKEKNPLYGTDALALSEKYRSLAARYLCILQKHLTGSVSVHPTIRDNQNKKTCWQ
ncbi:MAG: DUF6712 family protein [Odoribacter sp.]